MIPRLQAFEFEDQPWLPEPVRDGITDYLQHNMRLMRLYHPAAPMIARLVQETGERHILDLCSGAGGPWLGLLQELRAIGCDVKVRLTDRYPNRGTAERLRQMSAGAIEYVEEGVDVMRVPEELRGLRTMFTSFHHFAPDAARSILRDAARARAPIAIFECTERKLVETVLSLLMLPPLLWLEAPFVRPVRMSRLLLTYVLPIIPLIGVWDGVVSNLRTYTPRELLQMAEEVAPDYLWESGQVPSPFPPVKLTYLTGRPRK